MVDATNYRSIVGSLGYLVNTRPDLAYSVGYVSRFMEAPREEHLVAVKHIPCYVPRTSGWGVRYCAGRGRKKLELVGYNDSVEHNSLWETLALFINTNREENTRHSVEYFCFLLFLDFLDE